MSMKSPSYVKPQISTVDEIKTNPIPISVP